MVCLLNYRTGLKTFSAVNFGTDLSGSKNTDFSGSKNTDLSGNKDA